MNNAILLISCPDRKGITAAVTGFIAEHNGNIIHADQHIDEQSNTFFMRVEWALDGFDLKGHAAIEEALEPLTTRFVMDWQLHFSDTIPRVAVFVSRQLHCLYDLLLRQQTGRLRCAIPVIVSNHPDAKTVAREFGKLFIETPVTPETRGEAEAAQMEILQKENIDLVVLARYHQVLSGSFVERFPQRIINIHHSFLPAFAGKNPYAQAYRKGVKIIGATSHFVIEELDQGPIIEQDTARISHRDSLDDLKRKGEDLERLVLGRAVRLALEKKILCYGNKTVIFD